MAARATQYQTAGRDTAPRLDGANLIALTSLMNPGSVNQTFRAEQLEQAEFEIMGRAGEAAEDPAASHRRACDALAQELGLGRGPASSVRSSPAQLTAASPLSSATSGSPDGSEYGSAASSAASRAGGSEAASAAASLLSEREIRGVLSDMEGRLGISLSEDKLVRPRVRDVPGLGGAPRRAAPPPDDLTEKRHHVESILDDLHRGSRTAIGVERERERDSKANKLEHIGQLRLALDDAGLDTSAVASPDQNSPMEKIDEVLFLLQLKNDRIRCSMLAEEVLVGAAEGLAMVFDGTRELPLLGVKLDYRGYPGTVSAKVNRMRHETGMIVSQVLKDSNAGPLTRIMMELIPSLVMYPYQQFRQKSSRGLEKEQGFRRVPDASDAYRDIRRRDSAPRSLDDI